MIEILGIVGQLLLELLLEFLLEALGGFLASLSSYRFEKREHNFTLLKCLLLSLVGAGLGALSWSYAPHLLIGYPWLRFFNLVAAPLLSGYAAHSVARMRQDRGEADIHPRRQFWFGFSACLGLVAVRLLLGLLRP